MAGNQNNLFQMMLHRQPYIEINEQEYNNIITKSFQNFKNNPNLTNNEKATNINDFKNNELVKIKEEISVIKKSYKDFMIKNARITTGELRGFKDYDKKFQHGVGKFENDIGKFQDYDGKFKEYDKLSYKRKTSIDNEIKEIEIMVKNPNDFKDLGIEVPYDNFKGLAIKIPYDDYVKQYDIAYQNFLNDNPEKGMEFTEFVSEYNNEFQHMIYRHYMNKVEQDNEYDSDIEPNTIDYDNNYGYIQSMETEAQNINILSNEEDMLTILNKIESNIDLLTKDIKNPEDTKEIIENDIYDIREWISEKQDINYQEIFKNFINTLKEDIKPDNKTLEFTGDFKQFSDDLDTFLQTYKAIPNQEKPNSVQGLISKFKKLETENKTLSPTNNKNRIGTQIKNNNQKIGQNNEIKKQDNKYDSGYNSHLSNEKNPSIQNIDNDRSNQKINQKNEFKKQDKKLLTKKERNELHNKVKDQQDNFISNAKNIRRETQKSKKEYHKNIKTIYADIKKAKLENNDIKEKKLLNELARINQEYHKVDKNPYIENKPVAIQSEVHTTQEQPNSIKRLINKFENKTFSPTNNTNRIDTQIKNNNQKTNSEYIQKATKDNIEYDFEKLLYSNKNQNINHSNVQSQKEQPNSVKSLISKFEKQELSQKNDLPSTNLNNANTIKQDKDINRTRS